MRASKSQGENMSKNDDWLVADEQVERCSECPHPNGCIRECIIERYVYEDVSKIRDEEDV